MKMLRLLTCFITYSLSGAIQQESAFIKSFVTYYDCSQEGRYTHEYHPYLLQATKCSLQQLEAFFQNEGFVCPTRVVIMGYQEEGVASFLPSMHYSHQLDDEYVHQSRKGRVVPAHNVFGFLTGFLLKDSNWMQKQWFAGESQVVCHHMPERIALFNDYAYLFQKTAFGNDINGIFACRDRVETLLKKQQGKLVLKELVYFWKSAYKGELKSFSHQLLATQDILFSIEYAEHLCASTIPIRTIYTGPDITYPIEVLSCQEQKATESAQQFVAQFGSTLVPVSGKKTAYVFCSFVDGVGKSTLLGNIINWKKYGSNIEKYERVDNSSSQRATLYQLDDQVVILDLPAQLSHSVSKPDGYVFVPLVLAQQQAKQPVLESYVQQQAQCLEEKYKKALQCSNYTMTLYDQYVAGAKLFGSLDEWIPFEYQEETYLFKKQDPSIVHIAVPLEGVQSRGLKVAHPTHMLFTKGLLLPMHTQAFMQECDQLLKNAGVEQLVFVDFLSMYPRSSRENVRVNFLLQELKKVYGSLFNYEKSLYKTLVNGNLELLYDLQHQMPQFAISLVMETVMRTALFTIFNNHSSDQVCALSSDQVTQLLRTECAGVLERNEKEVLALCQQKIMLERQALQGSLHDRTYQTVVDFSWKPVVAFSRFMQHLWTRTVYNPVFSELWSLCPYGIPVKDIETFAFESRDPLVLAKIIPCLRAAWYISLMNLVHTQYNSDGSFLCSRLEYPVIPIMVVPINKQSLACVQCPLAPLERMPEQLFSQPFLALDLPGVYEHEAWGTTYGTVCMQPLPTTDTATGLFGLGYDWRNNNCIKVVVHQYVEQLAQRNSIQGVMTSSELVRALDEQCLWSAASKIVRQDVMRNSGSTTQTTRTIKQDDPCREAIALMVRALATLEMIAKDQQSLITTRRGVYEDFKSTVLLLERVVLPKMLRLEIEGPLFSNYEALDPVIAWNLVSSYD